MAAVWTPEVFGQQLLDAAELGNEDRVVALLDQGVDVNSRGALRYSPLMLSSLKNHLQVVRILLDRGADPHAADYNGWTSIIFAAREGHLEVVDMLRLAGASVNHSSIRQQRALHQAAWSDRFPVCELLIREGGADLMAVSSSGQTALGLYGRDANPPLSPETKALRCAALEAAWAAGPHPSQVQRRRDERWFRRGPILWVLAEHAYRPLLHRLLAAASVAAAADHAAPIQPVALATSQQRHAYLLGRVFSCEGIVRLLVALL